MIRKTDEKRHRAAVPKTEESRGKEKQKMKADKEEEKWDRLLRIRTTGRDDSHADTFRYPYEPTPYTVLQRLADAGYIRKGNMLLDYGCGKISG